uniref:Uncharacterized protein n=1 Tax=Attheya septentrionalis TaxID=420275 RepID=A0A7S2UK17_9STRA|mmetsp:Transcript_28426/g.51818  ORF Transcript_28426/g.51818 Transcript_28426/m.51818 type:complete len:674 (+) Transcript_28426:124-2145(+)
MRIASLSSGLLLWAFLALPCAVNAKGADNDRFEEKISDMKKKREDALGDYEAIAAKEAVTHKNEIQVKLKDFKKSPSSSSEFVKIQSELQISDKEFLEKVSEVKEEFKKKLMDISPAYTELGEKIKEVIDKNDVKDKDLPLNTWANEAKDSKELIDGYLRDLDSEVSASICCAVDNLKDQLSTKDLQMLTNDVLVAINNVLITSGAAYYGKSSPLAEQNWLEDFDSARHLKKKKKKKKNKKNKKEIVLNDYSGHLMMKFDPVFTCIDCFDPDVANEFQMWIIDGMPNVVQTHLASVFEIVLQDQMANKKVKTTCSPCGAWSLEDDFKGSDLLSEGQNNARIDSIEILEYVILAKQRKAVNAFMRRLQAIDHHLTVAGEPYEAELLTCFNEHPFYECDLQYVNDMDRLYNKFQEEADTANEVLIKELDWLSERINTIYEEVGGYIMSQQVQVKNVAKENIRTIEALISEKRAEYEDNVVCDIDGLRESLTEGQFRKMERIFQITTNYALVQAGFFDVTIKDVVIDEQCLIENNMCINATDTDRRMLTSRKQNILFARTQRIFQQMRTGHCTICPRRSLPSNAMRRRSGRKLQAKVAKASKAPNVAKASKEPTAPKEPKASKEQFSDVRYSNFFEETVSEEYAKKLATQQALLADPNAPSDVATMCRLYGNFLNE